MDDDALRLADALVECFRIGVGGPDLDAAATLRRQHATIAELRAELAKPEQEQEPVAWGVDWGRDGDQSCCTIIKRHADGSHEVVAVEYSPPRREWQSLTEDEIWKLYYDERVPEGERCDRVDFARAIEAALKERNHG